MSIPSDPKQLPPLQTTLDLSTPLKEKNKIEQVTWRGYKVTVECRSENGKATEKKVIRCTVEKMPKGWFSQLVRLITHIFNDLIDIPVKIKVGDEEKWVFVTVKATDLSKEMQQAYNSKELDPFMALASKEKWSEADEMLEVATRYNSMNPPSEKEASQMTQDPIFQTVHKMRTLFHNTVTLSLEAGQTVIRRGDSAKKESDWKAPVFLGKGGYGQVVKATPMKMDRVSKACQESDPVAVKKALKSSRLHSVPSPIPTGTKTWGDVNELIDQAKKNRCTESLNGDFKEVIPLDQVKSLLQDVGKSQNERDTLIGNLRLFIQGTAAKHESKPLQSEDLKQLQNARGALYQLLHNTSVDCQKLQELFLGNKTKQKKEKRPLLKLEETARGRIKKLTQVNVNNIKQEASVLLLAEKKDRELEINRLLAGKEGRHVVVPKIQQHKTFSLKTKWEEIMPVYEGSLFDQRSKIKTVDKQLDVASQLADGLTAMHESGVIHGDLKLENVLVRHDHKSGKIDVGLADFGGGLIEEDARRCYLFGFAMTKQYQPPEYFNNKKDFIPSKQSDCWAFGIMLFELRNEKAPRGRFFEELYKVVDRTNENHKIKDFVTNKKIDTWRGSAIEGIQKEINNPKRTQEEKKQLQYDLIILNLLNPNPQERLSSEAAKKKIDALMGGLL